MNCQTTKNWLLAAHRTERLPSRVLRHVEGCPACRNLRIRLVQVDKLTDQLLTLPDNPQAHAAIQARLVDAPRESSPSAPTMPARSRLLRRRKTDVYPIAAATAAILLIAVGWLFGRYSNPQTQLRLITVETRRDREVVSKSKQPDDKSIPIIVRIAGLAPRIVGESTPSVRLDILTLVADELRQESLRLASRGQVDELPRLATLHDRVLRTGIVYQVHRFPEGKDRDEVISRIVKKMERVEEEVAERERRLPPSVAERLKPFASSARLAARSIAEGKLTELPRNPEPANPPPLEGLITMVVKLSQEDAPLPRAEASAELSQILAQATVLLSAAGKTEYSVHMGEYLDKVMANGVADNLDTVEADDKKGAMKEKIAKVRERASEVSSVIERNLDKSEPEAKQGLQRALEASRHGQERASKGGKGKGPPWTRKDNAPKEHPDKGNPPGWQKKN